MFVPRPRTTAIAIVALMFLASLVSPSAATTTPAGPRVFAFYYLWWSSDHWHSALGPNYPYGASPLPLPATIGSGGCRTTSRYSGNSLTDVPSHIYSQDDRGRIETDVRRAARAGLSGFIVNWAGTGTSSQRVDSNPYSKRLQLLVDAVHRVNAAGIHFSLWLSYKASATILSRTAIVNDLHYFLAHYGSDRAFDRSQSRRPTVIWQGSRKYSLATLQAVVPQFRSRLRILGDESTWSSARARYLDGDAYYWSSQNPWSNPQSFSQLATLASRVRNSARNPDGTRKVWVSPLAPGYNKLLAGGSSCVPRRGGRTIRALYRGNMRTHPDDFGLISWNEITEGSYVAPMTRYGWTDLNALKPLITR